jgi:putative selenium metabolism protein SsnA
MILTNARILTFDERNRVLERGSVEVRPDGSIGGVGPEVEGDGERIDLAGRLLLPALINCHSHLYSTLARGIHLKGAPPADFPSILKKLWWRLDRALTERDVYLSALTGLIDSARCGVGTLIDHHASPNAIAGGLDAIARAYSEVGLRGATCYETSDRNGRAGAQAGIRENVRFLERTRNGGMAGGTMGGMFGLHAAFTLGGRTLAECAEAGNALDAGFHVHVSEDRCDRGAVKRLAAAGVLNERSIAAHAIHVSAAERRMLAQLQVSVAHNPQSNANNAVGIADLLAFSRAGVRVGLGSDGYSPRMWEEFKTAYHLQKIRAHDPRVGGSEAWNALFVQNREIVRRVLRAEIGRIAAGARADLLIVDYHPPTPLNESNLFGHLLFGVAHAPVHSLMVDGRWVLRDGRMVNIDEAKVAEEASVAAKALWERM